MNILIAATILSSINVFILIALAACFFIKLNKIEKIIKAHAEEGSPGGDLNSAEAFKSAEALHSSEASRFGGALRSAEAEDSGDIEDYDSSEKYSDFDELFCRGIANLMSYSSKEARKKRKVTSDEN